jgi:hypothetical protein
MTTILLSAVILLVAGTLKIRAQQPPNTGHVANQVVPDAVELLKKQKLSGLLQMMESNPKISLPEIHTLYYCQNAKPPVPQSCKDGNAFGVMLYKELRLYQANIKELSWPRFRESIVQLANLRDRLWSKGKFGNLILADLVDRMIYWRILYRATQGNSVEVNQLSLTQGQFRNILADWRSVARALEEEYDIKFDYKKIVEPKITFHDKYFLESFGTQHYTQQGRALYYLRMAKQLEAKAKLPSKDSKRGQKLIDTTLDMLVDNALGSFFVKQIQAGCILESRSEMLKYYMLLMVRCRNSSKLSVLKIDKSNLKVGFQVLKQLDKALPLLLPDIVNKKIVCGYGVSPVSFQSIAVTITSLHKMYESDIDIADDEEFELIYA